jgi:hypothetical protein
MLSKYENSDVASEVQESQHDQEQLATNRHPIERADSSIQSYDSQMIITSNNFRGVQDWHEDDVVPSPKNDDLLALKTYRDEQQSHRLQ